MVEHEEHTQDILRATKTNNQQYKTGVPGSVRPYACRPAPVSLKQPPTHRRKPRTYGPTRRFAHKCNSTSLRPAGRDQPTQPTKQDLPRKQPTEARPGNRVKVTLNLLVENSRIKYDCFSTNPQIDKPAS